MNANEWLIKYYSKRIKNKFNKCGKNFYTELFFNGKGFEYIKIGNNASFSRGVRIEAWDSYMGVKYKPEVLIGNQVCMNPYCHIGAINKIVIGDNTLIGAGVLITDHSHGKVNAEELKLPPYKRKLYSKGPVIIGKNAWIGEHAAILAGVTVGENAIIGANSVVTKNVPANAIVAGNPAKIIKQF